MSDKKGNTAYPRTLYKKSEDGKLSFTNKEHRNVRYDSVIVNNKEEKEIVEGKGYVDSFSDALFSSEVESVEKEKLPEDY